MPQANGQPFNILAGNCRSGCANIADVAGMRQEETLQRAARMSFDYFVAVHEADWPTAENLQESLKSLGYPLRLESAPPTPFEVTDFRTGLSVQFEGRPVILEASTEQATDVDDSDSLFGYIAECSTSELKISNGDYFLTLTFRSDAGQIRAGLYLAAAMILACNGYGFETKLKLTEVQRSQIDSSLKRQMLKHLSARRPAFQNIGETPTLDSRAKPKTTTYLRENVASLIR